ncbi:hypothetical protein D9M72_570110 [compost metagenome]
MSSLTKPFMSRGLVIRWLQPPNFMKTRPFAVNAKMWYSGRAVMIHSLPISMPDAEIHAEACCMLATRLRLVSMAPLATPVVPPVYCRKATSSWSSSTFGRVWPLPSFSAWLKRIAPRRV